MSSLPACIKRIGSNIIFPIINQWGAFCCHENQSFDPVCPETFYFRPHGYSSSNVWNFCHLRASYSKMSGLIRPKIELDRAIMPVLVSGNFTGRNSNSFEILCMSSLPACIKRIGSKTTEKRWRHHFPHNKSMGAFCCHGNQSFDPVCPETFCSLSPTPMMLHINFDQDWPTGFRDIQVQMCEIFVT